MTNEKIMLSEVPGILRKEFDADISYRQLYMGVLDGKVPAEKDASGARWFINRKDLRKIAVALKGISKNAHFAEIPHVNLLILNRPEIGSSYF